MANLKNGTRNNEDNIKRTNRTQTEESVLK